MNNRRVILFFLNNLLLVNCYSYLSTVEAFLKRDHALCLGNCFEHDGLKQCIYNWHGNEAACINSEHNTKKYRTIKNKMCYSNCGPFDGEDYDWCVIKNGDDINYEKCNRTEDVSATVTYQTEDQYLTCTDECTERSHYRPWCHTVGKWQYCDRNKKVILFSRYTEDNKKCGSPCALYYDEPYCYDVDGAWARCYLGADKSDDITEQSKHWESHWRRGEYTKRGYRLCKRIRRRDLELEFLDPLALDVETIARQREDEFPTVIERMVDPNNMITDDTDPTIQYTVFDTTNRFNHAQLVLPLVYRAIVTSNTLRRPGERDRTWPREINNNFNEMNPILSGDDRDERGHILASRLGGPTELFNIFPQSRSHNAGRLSRWYYMEGDIFRFLDGFDDRYAEYTAVLGYDFTSSTPFRPTGVGLTIRLYTGDHEPCDINGVPLTNETNTLANLYYTNDPRFSCIIEGDEIEDDF